LYVNPRDGRVIRRYTGSSSFAMGCHISEAHSFLERGAEMSKGSTTKFSFSGLVSCAGTKLPVRPKNE